jgi:hypothetical protein
MPTPRAPYLIVAMDLAGDRADHPDLVAAFADLPLTSVPLPLGVECVFAYELAPARFAKQFEAVQQYLRARDVALHGRLRWAVQLCERRALSVG